MFDRFLANGDGAGYFDMIHRRKCRCETSRDSLLPENLDARLVFGAIDNNLIFNYLDYLICMGDRKRFGSWDFTFRSSIEHFTDATHKDYLGYRFLGE